MKEYKIEQQIWDMDHWIITEYNYPKEDFWIIGKYETREEAEAVLAKLTGGKK